MKTLQDAFNRAVLAVIAQGRPSLDNEGDVDANGVAVPPRCAYRGAGGTRCAVGHLIADEHYFPGLENRPVIHEDVRDAIEFSGWPADPYSVRAYYALQAAHDGAPEARFVESFISQARLIARRFYLEFPV